MISVKSALLLPVSFLLYEFSLSQNVGIGTTTPTDKLTIQTATNQIGFTHTDGTVKISSYVGGSAGGGWIGTQSNHPFHIYTNNGTPMVTFITDFKGTKPWLRMFDGTLESGSLRSSGHNLELSAYKVLNSSSGTGNLLLQIANTSIFGTEYAGNVGIGDAFPFNKLTVRTPANSYGITHTDGTIYLSTYLGGVSNGAFIGTQSLHPLYFYTAGGGPVMTVATNNNIGIGTITPLAKLHVAADNEVLRISGNSSFLSFYNGANAKGYLWNPINDIELGTSSLNPGGNVYLAVKGVRALSVRSDGLISVNGPPAAHESPVLTVNGVFTIRDPADEQDEWDISSTSFSNDLIFDRNGSDAAYVNSNGEWVDLSDATLKENILTYKSTLEGVKKLHIATYHYKSHTEADRTLGLIAQDVVSYFPEIVSQTKNKKGHLLMGIAYGKTGVIALKAIQEQQDVIEQQQQKIEALEKRLAALEKNLHP